MPVFGCNKAISRCTEVRGRGGCIFLSVSRKHALCFCSLAISVAVKKMDMEVSCNPPTTNEQLVRIGPARSLKLCIQSVLQVKDHSSVSVCRSLEKLPKQWEWAQQETGFLLKAQSFRLVANLHQSRGFFL